MSSHGSSWPMFDFWEMGCDFLEKKISRSCVLIERKPVFFYHVFFGKWTGSISLWDFTTRSSLAVCGWCSGSRYELNTMSLIQSIWPVCSRHMHSKWGLDTEHVNFNELSSHSVASLREITHFSSNACKKGVRPKRRSPFPKPRNSSVALFICLRLVKCLDLMLSLCYGQDNKWMLWVWKNIVWTDNALGEWRHTAAVVILVLYYLSLNYRENDKHKLIRK